MGAVGASAPMLFEVVGASTHTFWQLLLISHTFEGKYQSVTFYDTLTCQIIVQDGINVQGGHFLMFAARLFGMLK